MHCRRNFGLTLVELLVVMAIIGLMLGLLIPAIQAARESARRIWCCSNIRQITLATLNYESAHKRYPPGRLAPDWSVGGLVRTNYTNYTNVDVATSSGHWTGFRSVHTFILPFFEQSNIYQLIDFRAPWTAQMTTGGGTAPFNPNYGPFSQAAELFTCPSCPYTVARVSENNYRYNFGGSTPFAGALSSTSNHNINAVSPAGFSSRGNGAFTIGLALSSAAITDGLSNTVFFSERTKGSGADMSKVLPTLSDLTTLTARPTGLVDADELLRACQSQAPSLNSGFNFNAAGRWLSGSDYSNGWPFAFYTSTLYNHVAPPNWRAVDCGARSAIPDVPGEHAIVSARSLHPGGVNVGLGDGSARFIADSIDLPTWRALGTRNGSEVSSLGP